MCTNIYCCAFIAMFQAAHEKGVELGERTSEQHAEALKKLKKREKEAIRAAKHWSACAGASYGTSTYTCTSFAHNLFTFINTKTLIQWLY
jgi:hypothetical protein